MIKLLKFLLLVTIFITPLIPAYFGFGYELIKVIFFLSLTILTGLVYLCSMNCDIRWTKIKLAGLVFLAILSLTSIIGTHPFESLVGKYPYYQGLILYWFLFLFFLMVSQLGLKFSLSAKVITVSSLIIAITAITEFILLNILKVPIPNYAGRVISTFGQPNLYSGFLLLSLPLIFKVNSSHYLILAIIITAIILSFSKAAIILLAAVSLWFLISKLKQKGPVIFLLILFFINILVFSLEKSSGIIWDEVIKPLSLGKADIGTVEKRAHILPVMMEFYFKSPLRGSGIDSINALYSRKFAEFSPETIVYSPVDFNLKNLYVDRSHSYFLDLLIFSGVFGLASYLYLIYLLFKKKAPLSLKVCLVLYLIWVEFQVQSIAHLMLFWMIAGIIDAKRPV